MGGVAVAVGVLVRALPLPGAVSVVVALLASAGAGLAAGVFTDFGARSAFLRPSNAGAVHGLHLVGGSSHPGGGLPLVAMSARIVADAIGPA